LEKKSIYLSFYFTNLLILGEEFVVGDNEIKGSPRTPAEGIVDPFYYGDFEDTVAEEHPGDDVDKSELYYEFAAEDFETDLSYEIR